MVATHSLVAAMPETGFLRTYVVGRSLKKALKKGGVESAISLLKSDDRLKRLPAENVSKIFRVLREGQPGRHDSPPELKCYEQLTNALASAASSAYTLDKDPKLIEFLPEIVRLWPQCRIIHICRDPRDVMFSKTKADWSKYRPFWMNLLAGSIQYRMGNRFSNSKWKTNIKLVRYETLVSEPVLILKALCDWLEIPYEPEMVDGFSRTAKQLVADDEIQWKAATLQSLDASRGGKWEKEFSAYQIRLVESANAKMMNENQYIPTSKVASIREFLATVHGIAISNLGRAAVVVLSLLNAFRRD